MQVLPIFWNGMGQDGTIPENTTYTVTILRDGTKYLGYF